MPESGHPDKLELIPELCVGASDAFGAPPVVQTRDLGASQVENGAIDGLLAPQRHSAEAPSTTTAEVAGLAKSVCPTMLESASDVAVVATGGRAARRAWSGVLWWLPSMGVTTFTQCLSS